jgi:hypothetical protein
MAELTVPLLDFSALGQLPQVYKKAQADELRQQTLASLGQGQLGISMQNTQYQHGRDDKNDTRQAAQDAIANQHWAAQYALSKRAADRADDPTPANFVKDPTAPGGYRPIGPADPAYLEQVAAAKARVAAQALPDGFTRGADGRLAPLPGGPQDPSYMESVAAAKARAASQALPEGFTQGPDGSLAPRLGGPTDPNYLARVEAEKARQKGDVPTIIGAGSSVIVPNRAADGPVFTNKISGGGLSNDALDIRAAQWNNGDYEGATKNVGRGAQGGQTLEAIANRAAQRLIENGMSPDAAAAATSQNMQKFKAAGTYQNTEARTGASREANLNIILKAADAAIPAALEASDKVSRTGFVPLNKVIQAGKVSTSDPDLRAFGMANLQLAEHWARAMNPTGVMRESDRDMALHFLSLADTKDTYKSSVMQLKTQITRERDAIRASTPGASAAATDAPKGPVSIGGYTITEH